MIRFWFDSLLEARERASLPEVIGPGFPSMKGERRRARTDRQGTLFGVRFIVQQPYQSQCVSEFAVVFCLPAAAQHVQSSGKRRPDTTDRFQHPCAGYDRTERLCSA